MTSLLLNMLSRFAIAFLSSSVRVYSLVSEVVDISPGNLDSSL